MALPLCNRPDVVQNAGLRLFPTFLEFFAMRLTPSLLFRFLVVLVYFVNASRTVVVADDLKPVRALLVLGGCCHDYNAQKDFLAKGIAERAHVEVVIALDKDTSTGHMNPV
jgi:hypothetical protein